jgi:GNAT superfamily N-acetyltransferase
LVGGAEAELDRAGDVAVMRASYVDPDWIRRGLGTLLARTTETAAELSGFTRFEAMCTPASEAMRRRLGYRLMERAELPLVGGVSITMAHMGKDSTGATGVTACREPASAAHR